jgi:hypothetical protein
MPSYDKKGFINDVADGRVDGWTCIDKFGYNGNLVSRLSDIWTVGGLYQWPGSGISDLNIVSTSAADAAGGSGAASMEVFGLDEDFREISEVVALSGTTPVALANTYRRIYRSHIWTHGSAAGDDIWNVGTINITGASDGLTYLQVTPTEGQTLHGLYTIPSGKTGYLTRYELIAGKNDEVFVSFQIRENGVTGHNHFDTKRSHVVTETPVMSIFDGWLKLPEMTDIRFRNYAVGASSDLTVNFTILLRDDSVVADAT